MKIGAYTTLFAEAQWLGICAPQLAVFDEVVVVASSRAAQWLGPTPEPEPPADAIRAICAKWGFRLEEGAWTGGQLAIAEQRQRGTDALRVSGCDAVAWFAVDELYTTEDANRLKRLMQRHPEYAWLPHRTYNLWHNENWELWYADPVSGLPMGASAFDHELGRGHGIPTENYMVAKDCVCWHFSWAKPDEDMHNKFFGYGMSTARSGEAFDEWKAWTPTHNVITWPSSYAVKVVYRYLPDELKQRCAAILPRLRRYEGDERRP